jgi:phytoene dehydrogenase-like protein
MANALQFIRCDPSEVIISKNQEVLVYSDLHRTIDQLVNAFPSDSTGIRRFFEYITCTEPLNLFVDLNKITFKDLLDSFMEGWEVKSALATLLGNIGLPSSKASALTSVFLFREFILDGGYYPKGGMQSFPDAFLNKFRELGGTDLLLTPAKEIELNANGAVKSVAISYRGRHRVRIETGVVVANCDPYQLYGELLAQTTSKESQLEQLHKRSPTVSAFMVHLGVKAPLEEMARFRCNIWSYRRGNIDDYFDGVISGRVDYGKDGFLFVSIPSLHDQSLLEAGYHSIQCIVAAPFFERSVWQGIKEDLAEDVINRLEQYIPGLKGTIEIKQIATPPTLMKYTWSYRGAMYGWASIPAQIGKNRIPEDTAIPGLFMVGQWTGLPSGHSGVPTVVSSGRSVARRVIREFAQAKHKKGIVC